VTTYYSNIISSGQVSGGRSGVYMQTTVGQVSLASGTVLTSGDVIQLCFISAPGKLMACHLDVSGALDAGGGSATLAGTLSDNQGTPVVYTASAGVVNGSGTTLGGILIAGGRGELAMGSSTGTFGVVDYTADAILQLDITTTANAAMAAARTINFIVYTQND
jgi:hypothetical protein